MPRIFTSANDPLDFCTACFPNEAEAEIEFDHLGDGPDGRGNCFAYDAEHPPYEDFGDYRCKECGEVLTERD